MSVLKLSLENNDSSETLLFEFDTGKSLRENVKSACKLFMKPPETDVFALKLKSTNDGKDIRNTYISESNIHDIKDGYCLKLGYSLDYYVRRIFEHLDDDYKERSFQDLKELSLDPEFIKELVKQGKHLVVIELFTSAKLMENLETEACLLTIVHLITKDFIDDIRAELVENLLYIVTDSESTEDQVRYSLSALFRILHHKNTKYNQYKEMIIQQLPLHKLTPHLWNKHHNRDLQAATLVLINGIIKCYKDDRRRNFIKKFDSKNRLCINKHVIEPGNIPKSIAKELHVLQTHLLRCSLNNRPVFGSNYRRDV